MPSGNRLVASIDPSETNCFANLSYHWLGRLLWIRDDEGIHNSNEVRVWETSLHHGAQNRNLYFKTRKGYKNVVQLSFAASQFSTSLKSNHTANTNNKELIFFDKEQAKPYF